MEKIRPNAAGADRLPSGILGLDTILCGGFRAGGIYMVMGPPGAGKTILSNQICYNTIARGGRALYVTLLAETHDRLITHLQSLSFFDPSAVAKSMLYINGYSAIEQDGLRGLTTLLRKELLAQQANVLVLDGITTVESAATNDLSFKRFIHELQAYAQTIGCTTFLSTPLPSEMNGHYGHTMVDGLVELSRRHIGPRAVREVEIHKFRGSEFLEGSHRLTITGDGITIYPRIETMLGRDAGPHQAEGQSLQFGIEGLDRILHGGVASGAATMVLGPPGSGKTMLGLHFLHAGARQGESGLYVGFYEQPDQLVNKARQLGLDFASYVDQGLLNISWHPPQETIPDAIVQRVLAEVRRCKPTRLFIDGFDALDEVGGHAERLSGFAAALTNELRSLGVTTIFSMEQDDLFSPRISGPVGRIAMIADIIIALRYAELNSQLYRLISIVKARISEYDTSIHELTITRNGVMVASTFDSAEAILTGIARPRTARDEQGKGYQDADDPDY